MFIIRINDIAEGMNSSISFMADSAKLVMPMKHRVDYEVLQNYLLMTAEWSNLILANVRPWNLKKVLRKYQIIITWQKEAELSSEKILRLHAGQSFTRKA